MTKDLHQLFSVATHRQLVVKPLELSIAHARKARERDVPHAVVTDVRVETDCNQGSDSAVALSTSFRSGRTETALFFPCYLQQHCFFPVVYNGGEADSPFRLAAKVGC